MGRPLGLRLQASVVQDNVPAEVCEGLFIGSVHAGFNVESLKEKRITHVLNLAGNYTTFPEDFTYLSINVRDKEHSNLLSILPIAIVYIDGALKVGGVLVHCSGGRSRSPAVIIAYLMIKKKLTFSDAQARVKALRPVMSLNAGFEEQLRCLEAAGGDIFTANQLVLDAKMQGLSQQRKTGELVEVIAARKKKQQQRHGSCKSFRLASMPSGHFQLAFDERDMLCGKVPSGFCLSMPSVQIKKGGESTSSTTEFIPALRSMATVFGCRECGTGLFCASAVIQHTRHGKRSVSEGDDAYTSTADMLRDAIADDQVNLESDVKYDGEQAQAAIEVKVNTSSAKKKPLLSKLRLRPHSPSVLRGISVKTGKAGEEQAKRSPLSTSGAKRPSAESLSNPNSSKLTVERRPQLLQTVKGRIQTHQNKYDKENSDDASSSSSSSSRAATIDDMPPVGSQQHIVTSPVATTGVSSASQRAQVLWRSIATLKAAKRNLKDAIEKRSGSRTETDATNKASLATTSHAMDCQDQGAAAVESSEALFLKDNTLLWEQGIRQILHSGLVKSGGDTATCRSVRQLSAILDADSRALAAALETMSDCRVWFVEPQTWFLDSVAQTTSGSICCPNEECGTPIGEWNWDGTRCSCGEMVRPAFAMDKTKVRVLGVLTARSSPQLVIGKGVIDVSSIGEKLQV